MSWTEVAGFATGALCVYLVVRQHIANFPVGIANNVFFSCCSGGSGSTPTRGLQVGTEGRRCAAGTDPVARLRHRPAGH